MLTIKKSRPFYEPKDVQLFKCTPPLEICIWGAVCFGFPLMATTKRRIRLLEDAAADRTNGEKRAELIKARNSGYCGEGITGGTIGNIVVAGALDQIGGDDVRFGGLYASAKTLSVREVIVPDKSGKFMTALKAICCGLCMNCNNAYVVHQATERYLGPGPVPAAEVNAEVTAVLIQPEAVPSDLRL